MTTPLPRGLYELLVTELIDQQLRSQQAQGTPDVDEIRGAEVADRIALHVARVVETAIESAPEEERVEVGAELGRRLIEQAIDLIGERRLAGLQLAKPAKVLRAIRRKLPNGQLELIPKPLMHRASRGSVTRSRQRSRRRTESMSSWPSSG